MKSLILAFLVLTISAETFAQVRGPRYNPPGGNGRRDDHRPAPGPSRNDRYDRHDNRDYRPDYRGGTVVVSPRYTPRRDSGRVIRTYRRGPIIWSSSFGYTCNGYMNNQLFLNGRFIHDFRFSSDCYTALNDIRLYGDFCDNEDLYDQSGRLEAQFYYNYECRNALGYYY